MCVSKVCEHGVSECVCECVAREGEGKTTGITNVHVQ